jgi:O-antigen/teichoic acid export membrane protein
MRSFLKLGQTDKYFALGGNLVRAVARMLVAIGLARLAGPDAYASFVVLATLEVIVLAIGNSLYVAPMISVAPGCDPREQPRVLGACLRRLLRWSVGLGLLGLLGTPLATRAGVDPLAYVGFCLSTTSWSVAGGWRGWRCAGFRARRAFWSDVAGWSCPFLGLVAAAALGRDLLTGFWWSSALGGLVSVVGMGWPETLGRHARPAPALRRQLRSMGRHMTVGTLANSACSRVQPFILAAVAGATVVGIFGAASTLIGPVRVLSMSMSGVLRHRVALHLSRGERAEVTRMVVVALGLFALAGTSLMTLFVVAGEELVELIFGSAFLGLERILPWAVAFAVFEAIGATLVVVMQTASADGAAVVTRLRIGTTVLALLLVWPACSLFGAAGAFGAAAGVEVLFVGLLADRLSRVGRGGQLAVGLAVGR